MNGYYEVIKGTDEYNMANKVCYCVDDWRTNEVKQEFGEVLGDEIRNSMCTNPNHLICSVVPDDLKTQFKKNRNIYGHYEAKVKSDINKKFKEIVSKHNLQYFDMIHFTFMFNCLGNIKQLYHTKVDDEIRYFIEVVNVDSKPEYFNDHKSLAKVVESEFLKVRSMSAKESEQ